MKKIAIFGECMIELNGEPFGNMHQTYGGDSLNTATYLTRISRRDQIEVNYVSALGTDRLSQGMKARWQADGIQTQWVLTDPARQPGLYLIQLDAQGERTFLYWRNQSAARYLLRHPDYPKVSKDLKNVDMVYLSGISLAILPEDDRLQLIAQLQQLARQGVEIAFDSNYRPNLWQSPRQAQQAYTELLPFTSLALVTFDDEQALWQDTTSADSLQRLESLGVKTIVIKQGKAGAIYRNPQGESETVATHPVKKVVDTTSAGDSFNAGFLQGYLLDKPLRQCCRQGNQLAGIVIRHKGAIIDKAATESLALTFN